MTGPNQPFRVVIPARYASTRLPGKPLRTLAGRPMIEHVYRRAKESGAAHVLVATDDARIEAAVQLFGGECVRTSSEHASGTDRIAEVADRLGWEPEEVIVNLQGDEPCMSPDLVRQAATILLDTPGAGIATLAVPIRDPGEVFDPNVVKVVLDDRGRGLYFSRAPIPYDRDGFASDEPVPQLAPNGPYLRHVGLYAYRAGDLRYLAGVPQADLEKLECLEQLRALAVGIHIQVGIIEHPPPPGVDTEADLRRAEIELSSRGL